MGLTTKSDLDFLFVFTFLTEMIISENQMIKKNYCGDVTFYFFLRYTGYIL